MNLAEFDFDLPEDRIALRPANPRRSAKLLVSRADRLDDHFAEDLPTLLKDGDLLVFNDTKVIPARLRGERRRSSAHGSGVAKIEALLTERLDSARWRALARPGKRLAIGDRIFFEDLTAELVAKHEGGSVELLFDCGGSTLDRAIAEQGEPPLPPYIAGRRAADAQDREDYQTVFARKEGAVAAPTAALHFDTPLLTALDAAGIRRTFVTLHVGAGTFLPVSPEDLAKGRLHKERGQLGEEAMASIEETKAAGGRVIAVGTTATRVLETAALAGEGRLRPWRGETDIFIAPGFRFQVIDALMTNFHLPRSTLIMLVAALVGLPRAREIYAHAIEQRYRFYSYGDASLLFP